MAKIIHLRIILKNTICMHAVIGLKIQCTGKTNMTVGRFCWNKRSGCEVSRRVSTESYVRVLSIKIMPTIKTLNNWFTRKALKRRNLYYFILVSFRWWLELFCSNSLLLSAAFTSKVLMHKISVLSIAVNWLFESAHRSCNKRGISRGLNSPQIESYVTG